MASATGRSTALSWPIMSVSSNLCDVPVFLPASTEDVISCITSFPLLLFSLPLLSLCRSSLGPKSSAARFTLRHRNEHIPPERNPHYPTNHGHVQRSQPPRRHRAPLPRQQLNPLNRRQRSRAPLPQAHPPPPHGHVLAQESAAAQLVDSQGQSLDLPHHQHHRDSGHHCRLRRRHPPGRPGGRGQGEEARDASQAGRVHRRSRWPFPHERPFRQAGYCDAAAVAVRVDVGVVAIVFALAAAAAFVGVAV
ncbi:hypothetical protein IWZ01DRAFT_554984, partial [Phyllosticta capitalensis]